MPRKTCKPKAAHVLPNIPKELIDQRPDKRALGAELTHNLGYAASTDKPSEGMNHRNGVAG